MPKWSKEDLIYSLDFNDSKVSSKKHNEFEKANIFVEAYSKKIIIHSLDTGVLVVLLHSSYSSTYKDSQLKFVFTYF